MTRAFPDAIPGDRGNQWRVETTILPVAYTNMLLHNMLVPMGDDDLMFALRTRQVAQAAHGVTTDIRKLAEKHGVSLGALMAAEQARLTYGMKHVTQLPYEHEQAVENGVLHPQAQNALRQRWAKMPLEELVNEAVLLSAGGYDTNDVGAIESIVDDLIEEEMHESVHQLLNAAQSLCYETLKPHSRRRRPTKYPSMPRLIKLAWELDKLLMHRGETRTRTFDEKALDKDAKKLARAGHRDQNEWGEMKIMTPPLVEDYAIKKRVRHRQLLDYGSQVARIDRLLVDEKVFVEQRFRSAGTVLVDCSGSMGFSAKTLRELVTECPSVTVAGYSGTGRQGSLVIMAEKGRMCEDEVFHKFPGGNIIDGPALRWLGTQAGPRLWISDGCVTGCGDQSAGNLNNDAAKIQLQNRIVRLMDFNRTAATLAELRRRRSA